MGKYVSLLIYTAKQSNILLCEKNMIIMSMTLALLIPVSKQSVSKLCKIKEL